MARNKASKLIELLEESRPALEAALADAERELEELKQRRNELEAVIARARAALGAPGTQPDAIQHPPPALSHGGGYAAPKARLTLHARAHREQQPLDERSGASEPDQRAVALREARPEPRRPHSNPRQSEQISNDVREVGRRPLTSAAEVGVAA